MSSQKLSLTNLPNNALDIVLTGTDLVSLQNLRKVCYGLRSYIDQTSPELNFKQIEINTESNLIHVLYRTELDQYGISYLNSGRNSCSINRLRPGPGLGINRLHVLAQSDFTDVFLNDLDLVLRNLKSSSLEILSIRKNETSGVDTNLDKILEKLESIFKSKKQKINVKKLIMKVEVQDQVMKVLPFLNPNVLKAIEICDPKVENENERGTELLEIDQIIGSEQWNELKKINMNNYMVSMPIDKLCHMAEARIWLQKIEMSDVVMLKNTLQSSPTSQSLRISFGEFDGQEDIEETFGDSSIGQFTDFQWYFRSSNPRYVLVVSFFPDMFYISFVHYRSRFVPRGAIVYE